MISTDFEIMMSTSAHKITKKNKYRRSSELKSLSYLVLRTDSLGPRCSRGSST